MAVVSAFSEWRKSRRVTNHAGDSACITVAGSSQAQVVPVPGGAKVTSNSAVSGMMMFVRFGIRFRPATRLVAILIDAAELKFVSQN